MGKESPSTSAHRGPVQPDTPRHRPALLCAFPRPAAIPLPDSGTLLGRPLLAMHGLTDSEVSADHVRIDRRGGILRVADVGSRNGTWVNGSRIAPGELTPVDEGAVLRIGRTILVLRGALTGSLGSARPLPGLVGPFGLRPVAEAIEGLIRSPPSNVLVDGETGVGKELVARAVATALRRDRPFSAVNVAGVARGVFESQMFGHVAGAFSDARGGAPGLAVANEGGTLFLDEIGELELDLQPKLLRLLENREVLPVGSSKPVHVNVFVIAATNRNLEDLVAHGTFRRDLFARLAMARIHVPALRERSEDVFYVAEELRRRGGHGLPLSTVEVEAAERLILGAWPNNVRELEATLSAVARIDPEPGLRLWALEEVIGRGLGRPPPLTEEVVQQALDDAEGNMSAAAAQLGVSRGRLLRFRRRSQKP